jgi:hypothetical protein
MNVGDVRNRVFISYAHEDIELAEDFRKHLAVRLRAEAPVWIDTEIRAGERWENALTTRCMPRVAPCSCSPSIS